MSEKRKENTEYIINLLPILVIFLLLILAYSLSSNHLGLPSMTNLFVD